MSREQLEPRKGYGAALAVIVGKIGRVRASVSGRMSAHRKDLVREQTQQRKKIPIQNNGLTVADD